HERGGRVWMIHFRSLAPAPPRPPRQNQPPPPGAAPPPTRALNAPVFFSPFLENQTPPMSALPPKADRKQTAWYVRWAAPSSHLLYISPWSDGRRDLRTNRTTIPMARRSKCAPKANTAQITI